MPYITKDKRLYLDNIIDQMHHILVDLQMDDEDNNMEGNLNYCFTRLIMMVYGDQHSTNYSQINDAMGVLDCVKQEYYRKVAAPYEDEKERINGSVEGITAEPEVVGSVVIDEQEAALDEMVRINQETGQYD